jgi:uncharacterized protein (DUF305 family)
MPVMPRGVLLPVIWLIVGLSVGAAAMGVWLARAGQPSKPGPVDVGYSQDMATHHAQAVLMASMVSSRASPRIAALASQIELAQSGQIGVLDGWLTLWGAPTLSSRPMRWMVPICGEGAQSGLATQAELAELQTTNGMALDQAFLRLMLRHHRGGVTMDLAAIQGASLSPVRAFASLLLSEEVQEIGLMNELQSELPASAGRAPKAE